MASAPPSVVRDCETIELAAVRSWFETFASTGASVLRAGHRTLGGGLLVHSSIDVLMYNRVLGLGVTVPALERDLDEALARFRETGARRFMVQVAPGTEPGGFTDWLAARGFRHHNHWIRLTRDLAEPIPEARTELRLATLGPGHADAFGRLEVEAFGHPPELAEIQRVLLGAPAWSAFGAFDGDRLVAACALRVQGAAAWLGSAATLASHRGRGAQSALIAQRLAAAREAGCRWACVETAADTPEKPNPSTHNLRRLGFRDAYERQNWVRELREP
jgi:GNAT superfamily N-acetyltransferase